MSAVSAPECTSIDAILTDRRGILRALENDPLLTENHNDLSDDFKMDSDGILKKEAELSRELRELNSLKTVQALILEFKTNLELLELENCYYSLKSLRAKLHDNAFIINQSFLFQQSIVTYVDELHLNMVEKVYDIITNGFWQITEDSIKFTQDLKWGEEQVDINYGDFMEFLDDQYFPKGYLDSNLWIVANMVLGDLQETVRWKLSVIAKDYIHSTVTIEKIKMAIFKEKMQFSWDNESRTLTFRQSNKQGEQALHETIISFKNITYFISEIVSPRDATIFAKKVGSIVANELLKFIKTNASIILHPLDSPTRVEILRINENLKKISEKTAGEWIYRENEIKHMLDSDEIHVNLQLEKVFQEHLLDIRAIFDNNMWSKLVDVTETKNAETKSNYEKKSGAINSREKHAPLSSKKQESDDWAWEADDGWDEQMEVNMGEDTDSKASKSEGKGTADHDTETGDDWDNAWDIGIDDEREEKSEKTASTEITQLPMTFISSIEKFRESWYEIAKSKLDQQYYHHKLNVLQTTLMAVSARHFEKNWWQLYIDMTYIVRRTPSLTRLQELTFNYIELQLNTRQQVVYNLVTAQLENFVENEHGPSWDSTFSKLLPFIHKEIIEPFTLIGNEEAQKYLLRFANFLYTDCIIERILKWKIISEKNSENLAEFVSLIWTETNIQILEDNAKYRQSREKFAIISRFLPLHLKEIMEMFYNGDFYLFKTEEIVQWIVLLFAETPLRRNAIDDIFEIRNANVDEEY